MHAKETVERALRLSHLGYNARQVARLCGVSVGAWRSMRARSSAG
jgi:DNA-directed RNA polymerase specialized sigma24 family protein